MDTTFDILVLGGGSGGYACALRAAQLGLSVGLVEEDRLGGTCLHVGCIPTKALLQVAHTADTIRGSSAFGVGSTLDSIDMAQANSYKAGVVSRLHKGLRGLVDSRGIVVIAGRGRLSAPREVTVTTDEGEQIYRASHVVLATGSSPRRLPDVEVDGTRVMTSEHALELDHVPTSAVVMGAGAIGSEFASAWRSLGAEVTVVEALPRMVAGEDEDCSAALRTAFRRRGIDVRTGVSVTDVGPTDRDVTITLDDGTTITAEVLLLAIGRAPSTEGMGFAEQGVTLDRGFVVTDDFCRTGANGVYAVGDIVPGLQLAHRGFAQGIMVAEHIAGLRPLPVDETGIPRVTYSSPEVASVGLTAAAAAERYGADDISTATYDLAGNGKSQILKTTGFVKLVRRRGGAVVGVHMVGAGVGELISEAQLIYNWEALPKEVATHIHAHPTQGEALGEAHLALAGTPLHAHS